MSIIKQADEEFPINLCWFYKSMDFFNAVSISDLGVQAERYPFFGNDPHLVYGAHIIKVHGKLPFYKAGKSYKFKISEVDEWVREGRIQD